MYKTFLKPLEIQKFPFKKVLSLIIEYRMYLKISSKTLVPWFAWSKTSQALRRKENKVEFLAGQFRNEKLSFVHKEKTEDYFEPSLSIRVFFLCSGAAPRAEAPLLSTLSLFFLFHCSTFCRACPSFSCPASILTTTFGVPNIFISLCSASAVFTVLQINSMNATRNSLSLNE